MSFAFAVVKPPPLTSSLPGQALCDQVQLNIFAATSFELRSETAGLVGAVVGLYGN